MSVLSYLIFCQNNKVRSVSLATRTGPAWLPLQFHGIKRLGKTDALLEGGLSTRYLAPAGAFPVLEINGSMLRWYENAFFQSLNF